jgi:hypothetical protein
MRTSSKTRAAGAVLLCMAAINTGAETSSCYEWQTTAGSFDSGYQDDSVTPCQCWERGSTSEHGRAALMIKLLSMRFGALTPETRDELGQASISDLDAIAERLLTASTLQEALGQ